MGRIGGGELLLILLIALLVFGPTKLADMGKGLGEGLKNFKKGLSPEDDAKRSQETKPAAQTTSPQSSEAPAPQAGQPQPVAEATKGNIPPPTT